MERLKKYWFSGFIYASLVFLLAALYRADYLVIPNIYSPVYLFLSLVALCSGFVFNALAWKQIMDGAKYPISLRHGVISTGFAVFGKYIPGKLWSIVGQGGYIADKYHYPKAPVGTIILFAQVTALWIGLILSAAGLVFLGSFSDGLSWSIVVALVIFSGVIFTDYFVRGAGKLVNLFSKEETVVLTFDLNTRIRTSLMYLLNWSLWCAGFYFLALSLSADMDIEPTIGLSYAMALLVGFLALIVPGGIGVREGILVAYLTYKGFDLQLATTISIASRLWFLCGEFFIFLLALLLNKRQD